MACSNDTALDRLLHLASVNIKQKTTRFTPNKYRLLTPDDELLFMMTEQGDCLTASTSAYSRAFEIDAFDSQEEPVFSLRRSYNFAFDRVEVLLHDELVSVVQMEWTFIKPLYTLNDASNRPILRVKGNANYNKFKLQTMDKRPIGTITKQFRGFLKEMFSFADNYVITFPEDLDMRFKLAVISACILIDYRYHERNCTS